MDPIPAKTAAAPAYPDAAEFARHHKTALGLIAIGAGFALSGCVLGGVMAPPASGPPVEPVKPEPADTGGQDVALPGKTRITPR